MELADINKHACIWRNYHREWERPQQRWRLGQHASRGHQRQSLSYECPRIQKTSICKDNQYLIKFIWQHPSRLRLQSHISRSHCPRVLKLWQKKKKKKKKKKKNFGRLVKHQFSKTEKMLPLPHRCAAVATCDKLPCAILRQMHSEGCEQEMLTAE